jgi:ferritin-like metal-binding protein YciE
MKMSNLQDAFVEELRDLYNAETQLLKALPKLARAATSPDLRAAFEEHLEETRGHKERLERVFEGLGMKPKSKMCEGIKGIITEGEETLKQDAEEATMDAAIIGAAQKAEHYEIATYGTVRAWAQFLGLEEAGRLLNETLKEEEAADKKLTQLAEAHINAMAAAVAGEGEEEEEHEEVVAGRGRRAFVGSTDEDDGEEEGYEEIEGMGEEEEEEEEVEVFARGSKGRTGSPTTTGRGNAGSRGPQQGATAPTRRRNKTKDEA